MHKAKECVETNVQGGVRRPASMCIRISEPQIVILLSREASDPFVVPPYNHAVHVTFTMHIGYPDRL